MSIIDPSMCGFVKIFCYRMFTNKNLIKRNPSVNMNCYKSRVLHHQYNAFQSTFSGNKYLVRISLGRIFRTYCRMFKAWVKYILRRSAMSCISPHENKKALSQFYHKKCF